MNRIQLLLPLILLILLSACADSQEIQPTLTLTPVPDTTTPEPTSTPQPSPTPTPIPYLLEGETLLDWNENAGEYQVVSEGIDRLTTTADGAIVALDGEGSPKFVFVEGDWVVVKIPEGAENHEELAVPDRWVTVVNDEGKTEEIQESGVKVLVNPETGVYEYELVNEQWKEYTPRVMVVGEDMGDIFDPIEVPKEVIETAAETMENAEMIKRV